MKSNPVILVLDAGGTNLVFSAVKNGMLTGAPVTLPAASKNLEEFLQKLIAGFKTVKEQTGEKVRAISFAFPGPADYENGIIGDLENLPFFRGGVPLKKMLENHFKIPVFINNDGDLFTLGEALEGFLPLINSTSEKQYKNLLGVTLGTGFGGGIVTHGRLFTGDNSAAGEINRFSHVLQPTHSMEETLSIRGIKRLFAEKAGIDFQDTPEPFDIYRIGTGEFSGDRKAAIAAWDDFALVLADALANAVSLIDGCVVIGGGLSGAYPLFLARTVEKMNGVFYKINGETYPRMEIKAFNWHDTQQREAFLSHTPKPLNVPFYEETVLWNHEKKIAVGISPIGTSKAVALGAYHFAVQKL